MYGIVEVRRIIGTFALVILVRKLLPVNVSGFSASGILVHLSRKPGCEFTGEATGLSLLSS